ncbi:MAG: HAD family phosphatase [Alphaproteobacteria bacterium]|nr:HAD family phosphatase [Alphaproteobacteria bacterium]
MSVSPAITTVVFDLGNVLLQWDPEHLYRKLIPDDDERARFFGEVCTREWHGRHDEGVSFAENAQPLLEKHAGDVRMCTWINAWGARFMEMLVGPIEGSVSILQDLHAAGVPLYALSNWSAEIFPEVRRAYPFLDLFKTIVVSGAEKMMKPDPRIYEMLIARTGIDPARSIFIDDTQKNLFPAAELGLATHLFTSPEALRDDLMTHHLF